MDDPHTTSGSRLQAIGNSTDTEPSRELRNANCRRARVLTGVGSCPIACPARSRAARARAAPLRRRMSRKRPVDDAPQHDDHETVNKILTVLRDTQDARFMIAAQNKRLRQCMATADTLQSMLTDEVDQRLRAESQSTATNAFAGASSSHAASKSPSNFYVLQALCKRLEASSTPLSPQARASIDAIEELMASMIPLPSLPLPLPPSMAAPPAASDAVLGALQPAHEAAASESDESD